jgi:hypothetical protein
MKSVREQFVQTANSVLGDRMNDTNAVRGISRRGAGEEGAAPRSLLRQKIYDWARSPGNRQTLLLIIWVIMILILLLLTTISFYVSHWTINSYVPGIVVSTVLWAIFFGIVILFFFPSKLVITVFGSLLGISTSQLSSGASLLADCDKALINIAQQLGTITGTQLPIIHSLVWLFLVLVMIICLPAFFRD